MGSANDLKLKAVVANIRKIRTKKNYTQDYLAAKLGISQNAYSKIELGYSSVTLGRLISISDILEVELLEILDTDEKDNIPQLIPVDHKVPYRYPRAAGSSS